MTNNCTEKKKCPDPFGICTSTSALSLHRWVVRGVLNNVENVELPLPIDQPIVRIGTKTSTFSPQGGIFRGWSLGRIIEGSTIASSKIRGSKKGSVMGLFIG